MRRRILLAFISLTLFVLVVLEVPLGISYATRQRDELTGDVQRDTFFLANVAEELIEHDEIPRLERTAMAYDSRIGGRVVVLDDQGGLLVDTQPPVKGSRNFSRRPEVAAALDGSVATNIRHSETLGGGEYVYSAVPVTSNGKVIGVVRVSYPTSTADRKARRYWAALGGVALVSLAAAAAVGTALASGVTRPLADVEAAATRLGEGDLTARAPDGRGPAEVRRLGLAFNDTAARLEELIDSQDAFVADASHQLRTPLTALRLRLENLGPDVTAAGAEDLDGALDEVARLSRMVDGLLALARADRIAPGAAEPLDLGPFLVERAAIWEPVAAERDVGLVVQRSGVGLVAATSDRLDQALDNLLANALEVAPPGSTITIHGVARGPLTDVHVVDEGPGMSAEDRARAFDRFWRASREPGTLGGSGLGLAIVEKLVEADGGEVRLDAAADGGVDAVVTLRTVAPAP